MAEPATRRLPWGLLLTLGLLGLFVAVVYRVGPSQDQPTPWPIVLTTSAAAAAAFLTLRRLLNYFWGIVAALILVLHPLYGQRSAPFELAVRAEAFELIILASVTAGWELSALPYFAWRAWLPATVALIGAGGMAWTAAPQAGVVASLLTLVGLPLGALWATLRHREHPSRANRASALLLGFAGPPLGLLLACGSVRVLDWPVSPGLGPNSEISDYLAAAVGPEAAGLEAPRHAAAQLHRWAWPAGWVVLPLLALGLWCSVRRGRRQFAARRPPLPWILVLYTFVELTGLLLHPRDQLETVELPLAGLALLLALFGIAEVMRALTRPLMLLPPGERTGEG